MLSLVHQADLMWSLIICKIQFTVQQPCYNGLGFTVLLSIIIVFVRRDIGLHKNFLGMPVIN